MNPARTLVESVKRQRHFVVFVCTLDVQYFAWRTTRTTWRHSCLRCRLIQSLFLTHWQYAFVCCLAQISYLFVIFETKMFRAKISRHVPPSTPLVRFLFIGCLCRRANHDVWFSVFVPQRVYSRCSDCRSAQSRHDARSSACQSINRPSLCWLIVSFRLLFVVSSFFQIEVGILISLWRTKFDEMCEDKLTSDIDTAVWYVWSCRVVGVVVVVVVVVACLLIRQHTRQRAARRRSRWNSMPLWRSGSANRIRVQCRVTIKIKRFGKR